MRVSFRITSYYYYYLLLLQSFVLLSSAQQQQYYYTTTELGNRNYDITLGNPLKGLTSNSGINDPYQTGIVFSLEASYQRFDDVVRGKNLFDWTNFENELKAVSERGNHFIPRFFVHYPNSVSNQGSIALPAYLQDSVEFKYYSNKDRGLSPYYGDKNLLQAFKEFVTEFGKRYDGDKRLAFIQAGLLGFYGEWHTSGNEFVPDEARDEVIKYYNDAFQITPVQIRQPRESARNAKMGYHDDSFTYATLSGQYNGGEDIDKAFWQRVVDANQTDFWKYGVMGGEIRPDNIDFVFEDSYKAGTPRKQDFDKCVEITHTTYMKAGHLFRDEKMADSERRRANLSSAKMGYNFQIQSISAIDSGNSVNLEVTIEQIGVAPFYYPLSIAASCMYGGNTIQSSAPGVETIIDQFTTKTFVISYLPASAECLNSVTFTLESPWINPKNPMKFAQGNDGTIKIKIPVPTTGEKPYTPGQSSTTVVPPVVIPSSNPGPVINPAPVPVDNSNGTGGGNDKNKGNGDGNKNNNNKGNNKIDNTNVDSTSTGASTSATAPAPTTTAPAPTATAPPPTTTSSRPFYALLMSLFGRRGLTEERVDTTTSQTDEVISSIQTRRHVLDSTSSSLSNVDDNSHNADGDSLHFVLMNTKENAKIDSISSGQVIDLAEVGDNIGIRVEL